MNKEIKADSTKEIKIEKGERKVERKKKERKEKNYLFK